MTIACQPLSLHKPKTESSFDVQLKVTEEHLKLLKESPDRFIPSKTFNLPQIPGFSLQLLFAVCPHPGEGQKFVVALRVNNKSISKTTTFPIQMDYNVKFEIGNFSKRYHTSTVPVNPSSDNVDVFDALAMKVFNFNDIFDRKNNFFNNNREISVNVFGSICT